MGMSEEDKTRLYRKVKLSVKDLELIVQSLSFVRTNMLRNGLEAEVEYTSNLMARLKKNIEKEQL